MAEAASDSIASAVRAQEAVAAAAEAEKRARDAASTTTKAHGEFANRAMSLRTKRVGVIVNAVDVFLHYHADPLVVDALQKCVDREVRAKDFGGSIPGVEIKTETSAA